MSSERGAGSLSTGLSTGREQACPGLDRHKGAGDYLLALVVLGGGLLRFVGLGKESIWLDEATSIIIARMNLPSVVAWAAGDIHPPLYYLTLHFWLRLGESEFAVRALSAILGVITIIVVHALAHELFGPRVGLLSALVLAVSPLHIWYSQETRMYVMVTMWSLLASCFLLLALRRKQIGYWLGYVFASVLALYTHYFALFVLLFQNLFLFYWFWSNKGSEGLVVRSSKGLLYKWLMAELVIALLFLPWIPILCHQVGTGGGGWVEKSVGRPSLRVLSDTWIYFSTGLDRELYPVLLRRMAYVLFGVCVLAAVYRLFFGQNRGGVLFCLMYVGVPLLTVWLLSQVKPMYAVRYLLPFLPPCCILVAVGINTLKWNWARIVITLLLVLILLVGDWNAWRIEQNADWRGASSYVLEQAQPGDVVLFSPRWNEKPFAYYTQGRVEINMDLPIPVTVDAAKRVATDVANRYKRVWLVWERGHYSDPDGIVKLILDSQFGVIEERNFRGVGSLVLYDLAAVPSGD